jgi:hypothetical protein
VGKALVDVSQRECDHANTIMQVEATDHSPVPWS